jgi:hypothetical protein
MKCNNKYCSRPVEHPTDVFRNGGTPRIYCRQCAVSEHRTRGGLKGEIVWWAHAGNCSCGNRIFVSPSIRGTPEYPNRHPPKWLKALDCGRCVSPEDLDADYRQTRIAERARQNAEIERLWPESEAFK